MTTIPYASEMLALFVGSVLGAAITAFLYGTARRALDQLRHERILSELVLAGSDGRTSKQLDEVLGDYGFGSSIGMHIWMNNRLGLYDAFEHGDDLGPVELVYRIVRHGKNECSFPVLRLKGHH